MTYFIEVSANKYKNSVTWSDITDNPRINEPIYVYSNPASEYIWISDARGKGPLEISIFDLAGRKILSKKIDYNELNLSGLKAGTYIVSVLADEHQTSCKIGIIR